MKHEYRQLKIWQLAREINKKVYSISENFPATEKFGLISQIRRASISIASNISEGSSYESPKMFGNYLQIALGSLCEVETQFYLAVDINYLKRIFLKK
ncbi:MAG: four helix bundle protein [Bacteroidia bacterium]|nr:four helix bundle protein [Bacteroidia bacterium]